MHWMDDNEACDLLRVSTDNSPIIRALMDSVPAYVEAATGYPSALVEDDDCAELVKQLARFVLQLWYNPDGTDAQAMAHVVDSLAKSVRQLVAVGYLPSSA